MNGILDGKQHVATIEQCNMKWGGATHGKKFRCALCGYKFVPGSTFRFVMTNNQLGVPAGNPFVCADCDGTNEEVYARLIEAQKVWNEVRNKWWWFMQDQLPLQEEGLVAPF